ncbi:MAG: DUF3883 domain-containing protein [Bacteroidetes bacterium]|nr:DUF3883 domain-containing protein [Bacteroidota bacterium]
MNYQLLKHYIEEYKNNFAAISNKEINKWQAVKHFQDNWDIDSPNFSQMLKISLEKTKNLLNAGSYYPLGMITQYADLRPEQLRAMFRALYNEDEDVYSRIKRFKSEIEILNGELFTSKKSYQDDRAVLVYLSLMYPDNHFFYKYMMFKEFSKKLELYYIPVMGKMDTIWHYNEICNVINEEIKNDDELIKLHKLRIKEDCFYDKSLNILTQDFIYAVAVHIKPSGKKTPVSFESINVTYNLIRNMENKITSSSFKTTKTDFVQKNIDNKRIGYLGELFVIEYEKEKLKKLNKPNLAKKVRHISETDGDGAGYDIASFDENGTPIYIEVKTTKGAMNSTFYISKTELEKSKIEKDNYYLYRVHHFDFENNHADLDISRGEMTDFCNHATMFQVNLRHIDT